LQGSKFEPIVCDAMKIVAQNTPFENTIEYVGGQKFPDIVANGYYGVEVKTTKSFHWKTTGNSVMESTRVSSVEKIYLLVARLLKSLEIKIRPYEECLSDIVVTHSPRYLIDMDLKSNETIFDKMQIPYDKLRQDPNPIQHIVSYYKENLNPGETLWWIDDGDEIKEKKSSNIKMRLWGNLTQKEKNDYLIKGLAYFPEIFGNSNQKFNRFSLWLASNESIICNNVRDMFSAGGKVDYDINGKTLKVPQIVFKLLDNIGHIIDEIKLADDFISEAWSRKSEQEKLRYWLKNFKDCCTDENVADYASYIETEIPKYFK
ncbi:MAG: hypothetical protein GYA62_06235, partial [Bacteroidales bacterium]|nr:hypothetical protein [Bacteroidales bacterium]